MRGGEHLSRLPHPGATFWPDLAASGHRPAGDLPRHPGTARCERGSRQRDGPVRPLLQPQDLERQQVHAVRRRLLGPRRHPRSPSGRIRLPDAGVPPPRRNQPYPDGDGGRRGGRPRFPVRTIQRLREDRLPPARPHRAWLCQRSRLRCRAAQDPPSFRNTAGAATAGPAGRHRPARHGDRYRPVPTVLRLPPRTGRGVSPLPGRQAGNPQGGPAHPLWRGDRGVRRQPVAVRLLPAQRQRAGRFLRSALRLCLEVLWQHHPPGQGAATRTGEPAGP